jgi:drug/metabolite transporter (DMT)-like permease
MTPVAAESSRTTAVAPSSWLLLALGVAAASTSAVLIRYAHGAEPLAISFWRCAVGAAMLAPFAASRLKTIPARRLVMPAIAGAFLSVHFASWITSIRLTSVAASVVLVSTTPIFVAAVARLGGERLRAGTWVGIGIGLGGTLLVGGADFGGSSLRGDLLALVGGAMAAGYVLAGQSSRRDLGIFEYAVVTYGVAAVILGAVCAIGGVPLGGFPAPTWAAIAGMIVGPQLLGHTVINFVLKDIDATTVSVAIMAEPVVATLLAFVLLGETPAALIYPGGAIILAGIYLVGRTRKQMPVVVE